MSEEQVEELKKNPYYAKYADKIAQLQKYVSIKQACRNPGTAEL